MLVVSESYQNYKNVVASNQLTDVGREGFCVGLRVNLLRGWSINH
jgi:hypothetical protein